MSNKLDILITADNKQARQAFRQTEGDLQSLEKSTSKAGRGFDSLKIALGAAAAAGLAIKGAQIAFELAKGADAAGKVEKAYKQLARSAGASSADILKSLKAMSQGSISETDLMLAANKSMLLGVADSADEMAQLMEVAIERGAALGLSSGQAFNDIVTGLGRMSPLILDNLGIQIDPNTFDDYAASINKTAAELTDAEKKHALFNQVVADANGVVDANISSFASYTASVGNLKDALGELFLPGMSEAASVLSEGINDFLDAMDRVQAGESDWGGEIAERLTGGLAEALPLYKANAAELEKLQSLLSGAEGAFVADTQAGNWDSVGAGAREIEMLKAQIETTKQAMNALAAESDGFLDHIPTAAEAATAAIEQVNNGWGMLQLNIPQAAPANADPLGITNIEEHAKIAEEAAKSLRAEITALHQDADRAALSLAEDAFGAGGAEAAKSAFSDMRGEIRAQVDAWQDAGYPIELISGVLLPQYVAGIQAAGQATVAEIGNATGAMQGFQAAIGNTIAQLNAWRGQTAATLQGMSSGLVGNLGAEGAIEFYENATIAVQEQRRAWVLAGHDIERIDKILLPAFTRSLDDGYKTTVAMGGATRSVSNEYDGLASKVQSILSSATGPVSGVNAEDFLPPADDINENAKRLADIMVNGFKGQDWMGEFAAEAPDIFAALTSSSDPKGTAAQLLKDFQDGLRPELLDKGRAKEIVKRALMGEANTAALAQEIAGELSAELGMGLEEAQKAAAEALGLETGDEVTMSVILPDDPSADWTWPADPTPSWVWPTDPMSDWSWPSVPSWVESLLGWNPFGTPAETGGDSPVGANAGGTNFWRGGPTWVGERGPEIVNLPRGSQVIPNDQATGVGTTINVNATVNNGIDIELLANRIAALQRRQSALAY